VRILASSAAILVCALQKPILAGVDLIDGLAHDGGLSIVQLRMSVHDTFATSRDVRYLTAYEGEADIR
jgi:hypothetical protein